jgi:signal transduction histidine kinase
MTALLRRMRLRLPIRLKLALVSATLTFVILLLFALVVGAFTERKLTSSFDSEVRATAADLQERLRIQLDDEGSRKLTIGGANAEEFLRGAAAAGSVIRVLDRNQRMLASTPNAPDLGPPVEGLRDLTNYHVVARPVFADSLDRSSVLRLPQNPIDGTVAFIQYARPKASLDQTIAKVRFFLLVGVLGGTLLALFAGLAVARRAMRPIAGLTRAAREVAVTRNPAQPPLPKPEANDEVKELADTLEVMLKELDAARAETESALERQREFVADASHELRTPLTSILANLELLEDELGRAGGPRDPAAAAATAGSALRSSKRMRRLVGDLLLLARADAGRKAPRQTLDLAKIVREAASEAGVLASGHTVSLDLPENGEALIEASADDLHRLVLNLVENALLHTPAGTPVVASVRAGEEEVVLQVADRGPGVRPEQRERIFERFARDAGDRGGTGSGLGLAIVRAVAESHGGSVAVRDADGGGAVFEVRLPGGTPHPSSDIGVAEPELPAIAPE